MGLSVHFSFLISILPVWVLKQKPGLPHEQTGKRRLHSGPVQGTTGDYRVNWEMNFQAFSQL